MQTPMQLNFRFLQYFISSKRDNTVVIMNNECMFIIFEPQTTNLLRLRGNNPYLTETDTLTRQ